MSIPVGYTLETLAEYMLTQLGRYAALFDITAVSLAEAAVDVSLIYGDQLTETGMAASAILSVRKTARREAWRATMQIAADNYDQSSPNGSMSWEQLYTHAKEQWQIASSEAPDAGGVVEFDTVHDPYDPYTVHDDSIRVRINPYG